jgi:polysaccharide export outer membrane protein
MWTIAESRVATVVRDTTRRASRVEAPILRALLVSLAALSAAALGSAADDSAPAGSGKPEYRIGAGDTLSVFIREEDRATYSCLVRPDGRITIPLAGEVMAEGRSPRELVAAIVEALKTYHNEPTVTVAVTEIQSYRLFMLGQLNAQGVITSQVPMRLLQALAQAGGFNAFATRKILVMRDGARGREQIQVDYDRIISGKAPEADIVLQSGDVVVVQ